MRYFFMRRDEEQNIEGETLYCHRCGAELTEENSREASDAHSITGISAFCIDCEQKIFDEIARANGKMLALFACCMAFDVPCNPLVLDGVEWEHEKQSWKYYIQRLTEAGANKRGERILSFSDGERDIIRLFGKEMTEKSFAKYILYERARVERQEGTPEQRERWGTEPIWRGLDMTSKVYDALDNEYETRVKSFSGQTLTAQQDDTLRKVARLNVTFAYLMRNGQSKQAMDVQKMVDTMLASEQMRKRDEKPVEAYSFDTQVVACERAGFMEKGKFLNLEGVQKVIVDKFLKRKKYDYSLDVGDQALAAMYRTVCANADALVPTDMPEELELDDEFGEFADEETDEERENKRFAGMTKISYERKNKPKKTAKPS